MQAKSICSYIMYMHALVIRVDRIEVGSALAMHAMQCKMYIESDIVTQLFCLFIASYNLYAGQYQCCDEDEF